MLDSADEAYQRALRYLGVRARSSAEVEHYLRRLGANAAVIEPTLEKLCRLNYIDDEAFARNWALSRAQNQGYGPTRIIQELTKKGVADSIIGAAIKDIFAQEDEAARARKILQKKFAAENLREAGVLRRAVGFLQRRGYSSQVIFALLGVSTGDDC